MSSKPSSSKSDPRVAQKDVIVTRHKSALMKRQLRTNNRSMKHLTDLLKSPTKETLTNEYKNVQAKPKTPKKESLLKSVAKVQKLPEKVSTMSNLRKKIALIQDKEYHPSKVKRKMDVKKVKLKPSHDLQMVGSVTGSVKRKSKKPHKATSKSPKQAESPEHEELSMADVIRMVEDDLTDEDMMEILTCPSPVWWEDPPDEEYIEDAIFKQPPPEKEPETKTIEHVQVKKDVEMLTSSNEVIQPIEMPNLPTKSDNFLRKRSKLEILLGHLKRCDNKLHQSKNQMLKDDVIICSNHQMHNNGEATIKTKINDNVINDKTVEISRDEKLAIINKTKSSDQKPGVTNKRKTSDDKPGVIKKTKSSEEKHVVIHKRKSSKDKHGVIKQETESGDEKPGVVNKRGSSEEKHVVIHKRKSSKDKHGVIKQETESGDENPGVVNKRGSSEEKHVVIHKRKSSKDKHGVIKQQTESSDEKPGVVNKRGSIIEKLCVINKTKRRNDKLDAINETESSGEEPGVVNKRRSSNEKSCVMNERKIRGEKLGVVNKRRSSNEKPCVMNERKSSDEKPGVVKKRKSSNDKPCVLIKTKSYNDKPVVINENKHSDYEPGVIIKTESGNDKRGVINERKSSNYKSGVINDTKSSDDKPGVIKESKSSADKPGVTNERKSSGDKPVVINKTESSNDKPDVINKRKNSDDKPGIINKTKISDDKSNLKNKTRSSSDDNDVPKETKPNNDKRSRLSESDDDEILFDDSSMNEDELLRGLENMDIPIEHYKNSDVIVIDDDDEQDTPDTDIETKPDVSTTVDKKQALKRIFKPKKLTKKNFNRSQKNVPVSPIRICSANYLDSSKTSTTKLETDTIPETNLKLLDDKDNAKKITVGDEKTENLSKHDAVTVYKIIEEKCDTLKADATMETSKPKHEDIDVKSATVKDNYNKVYYKKVYTKKSKNIVDKTDINKNDVNINNGGDLELDVCELCKPKVKKVSDDENVKYCLKCSSIFDSTECTYCLEKSKARVFICTTCRKKFCCEKNYNNHSEHGAHSSEVIC